MDASLAAVYELLQYALLLQSSHYQAAALLATSCTKVNLEQLQEEIMNKMKREWQMVLRMEASSGTNTLLSKHCSYTRWQVYRETMTFAEMDNFELTERLQRFLSAWHPTVQGSCIVEDVFADLQDAIQRSGKSDTGSLSNLTAVSIRSVARKCEASSISTTELESADYEGTSVRSLKTSVFRPESCASSG